MGASAPRFAMPKRKAQRKQASPSWLAAKHRAPIKASYDMAERLTRETGVKHGVGHVVPLVNPRVCGLHIPLNPRVPPKYKTPLQGNPFDGGW